MLSKIQALAMLATVMLKRYNDEEEEQMKASSSSFTATITTTTVAAATSSWMATDETDTDTTASERDVDDDESCCSDDDDEKEEDEEQKSSHNDETCDAEHEPQPKSRSFANQDTAADDGTSDDEDSSNNNNVDNGDDDTSDEEESAYEDDDDDDKESGDESSSYGKEKAFASSSLHGEEEEPPQDENTPYWMHPDWIPTPAAVGAAARGGRSNHHHNTNSNHNHNNNSGGGGKAACQTHPDQIRAQLLRYMETALHHHNNNSASFAAASKSKTALLADLGVNSNSFRKFMDRSNYKDPWRAIENGTYWAAARFLEAERVAPNRPNPSVAMDYIKRIYAPKPGGGATTVVVDTSRSNGSGGGGASNDKEAEPLCSISGSLISNRKKRKAAAAATLQQQHQAVPALNGQQRPWKRAKKSVREAAVDLMKRIGKVSTDATEDRVFVNRHQIIHKINMFMQKTPGVSKANFCAEALQGVNRKSLDKLLATRKQKECAGLVAYGRAWVFFEKKRIFDGAPKSAERRKNEADRPHGFVVRNILPLPPSATAATAVVGRRSQTAV